MLGICLKQAPTRVKIDIDVVLAATFVSLHIGPVHADYVSNLSDDWAVFEAIGVDDDDSELEFFVNLVTFGVQRAIDDF